MRRQRARGADVVDELEKRIVAFARRGFHAQAQAFKLGPLTRAPGDTLVLALPFITTRAQLDQMIEALSRAICDTPWRCADASDSLIGAVTACYRTTGPAYNPFFPP